MVYKFVFMIRIMSKLILTNNRSNHRRCSLRKGVLRNFAKFTGKFTFLLKKRLRYRCFPVNFAKPFHRTRLDDCLLKAIKEIIQLDHGLLNF